MSERKRRRQKYLAAAFSFSATLSRYADTRLQQDLVDQALRLAVESGKLALKVCLFTAISLSRNIDRVKRRV